MIITIDGPAGSGKSTVARALARRLAFDFLDTGAMYRAVGLAALRQGVDLTDELGLECMLQTLRLEMPRDGGVWLDGVDVSTAIRAPEATSASSRVAASPTVRRHMVRSQRLLGTGRDLVTEGRDQGTVVFPQAFCKFFLTADAVERARRRLEEMAERGEHVDLTALQQAQDIRDHRDATRDFAPMRPAEDAIVLDTTGLSLDEVVDRLLAEIDRRRAGA